MTGVHRLKDLLQHSLNLVSSQNRGVFPYSEDIEISCVKMYKQKIVSCHGQRKQFLVWTSSVQCLSVSALFVSNVSLAASVVSDVSWVATLSSTECCVADSAMAPHPLKDVDLERKEELILAKQLRAARVTILPKVSSHVAITLTMTKLFSMTVKDFL